MVNMLRILILVVVLSQVFASESSEELTSLLKSPEGTSFLKGAVSLAYERNKFERLDGLIRTFAKAGFQNFTLIGTQNVYEDNGVVATRSIEYHWFKKNESVSGDDFLDSDEDDDVNELREILEMLKAMGLEFSIERKKMLKNGDLYKQKYVDPNVVYQFDDGTIQNKTFNMETISDVEAHIAEIKKNYSSVSVLKYNGTQFVKKGSSYAPEYFVTIIEEQGDPKQSILEDLTSALTKIGTEHGLDSNVPEQLRAVLKNNHPEYNFSVAEGEPDSSRVHADDFIKAVATFRTGNDDMKYTVYGYRA